MMQQLTQELEHDESRSYRPQMGSPITNSPPGNWAQFGSPSENSSIQACNHSPGLANVSPMSNNYSPGLASILPPLVTNPVKIAPIGKDQGRVNQTDHMFPQNNSTNDAAFVHSHSFPQHSNGMIPNMSPSPGTGSSFGPPNSNTSCIGTLSGPQFLWGSPTPYSEHSHSSAWSIPSMGHSFASNGQSQGFPHSNRHSSFVGLSPHHNHHHVGSAPSGVPFERHFGLFPESPETSFMGPVAFGGMGFSCNEGNFMMNMGARSSLSPGVALSTNMSENSSPTLRMLSSPRFGPAFLASGAPFPGPVTPSFDGMIERGRNRRFENNANQMDSKKQYQLDLDKIISGEDTRTTLMIKNIPNKYTSKMLLAAIDEKHRGTYDFFYLPIDFKNKCNVGYAFINMISPSHIIPFYEAFNGKKWEKFNSEKVASLAYARIQGKVALVAHFQNSSLMNEDKRCRPILFHSEGPELGDQEPFPSNSINIRFRQQDGTSGEDASGSLPNSNSDEKLENIQVGSSLVEG